MKITVDEFVDLNNRTKKGMEDSYKKGVEYEKNRTLPSNLFESLLEYGKKSGTLIDYHRSSSSSDSTNWIQLKPTRDGSEGIDYVEFSFEENLTEIDHIGVGK